MARVDELRGTAVLAALTGSTIFLSFLAQWYVVTRLGAGTETDAFFAGIALSTFPSGLIAGVMAFVLVPLLATESEDLQQQTTWSILQILGIVFGGMGVLLAVLASLWVPIFVPGFDAAGKALTISLVRVLLIGMIIDVLNEVLWSFHYARQDFAKAQVSFVFATIVSLVALIWLLPLLGIVAAGWTAALRSAVTLVILSRGIGTYRYPRLQSRVLELGWRRVRPMLIGTAYFESDLVIDRFLASMAPAGGLSLLALGRQITHATNRVLNKAISDPSMPLLARNAKDNNESEFGETYRKRLLWIAVLSTVAYLCVLLFGERVLDWVFGTRNLSQDDIRLLWWIMVALFGLWLGESFRQTLSNVFYALGDTSTPVRLGAITFTFGIAFKLIGFYLWGVVGIAIGISFYYILGVISLQYVLHKKRADLLADALGRQSLD